MSAPPLRILAVALAAGERGGFPVEPARGWSEASLRIAAGERFDAVVLDADAAPAAAVAALADRVAVVVVVDDVGGDDAPLWLRHGADDVISRGELASADGWRRLRFAVLRRQHLAQRPAARPRESTTGLPHRQQLVEHLSQLLALRERDPSPMAVLALRIELPAGAADEAELLCRKIAVRLRAGVRASDVVAAIDGENFAVLLGTLLSAADAARVGEKLGAAIAAPLRVGGNERTVPVALGIAHYPQDGNQAERLLRRALALAAVAPALSPAGAATIEDAAGTRRVAANDES